MPSNCNFNLQKKIEVYYAGEDTIEGHVTLRTTTVKKVRQIKIRFKGVCKVGFKQSFKYSPVPNVELEDYYFTAKEKVIKIEQVVQQSGELQPGTYTWPFSFAVPHNCYTSMEGIWGHIRYQLSLKIYNEEKYKNIFLKPVTIIKKITPPTTQVLPVDITTQPIFCCGSARGPKFHIRGVHAAYVPGQFIHFVVDILGKDITKQYFHEVSFIRQTKYIAVSVGKCKQKDENLLYNIKPQALEGIANQTIEDTFFIPPTTPTELTKYISVQYFLRVTAALKCCPSIFMAELPIFISATPLSSSLTPQQQQQLAVTPIKYQRCSSPNMSFVDEDTEEINRVDDFVPLYPVYEFV